jgi:hypothetical protein
MSYVVVVSNEIERGMVIMTIRSHTLLVLVKQRERYIDVYGLTTKRTS